MKQHIVTIRAVTSLYAQGILRPVLWAGALFFGAAIALIVFLAQWLSGWWNLLLVPVLPTAIIFFIVWILAWHLARAMAPGMNSLQKQAVRAFVQKVQEVAEGFQTHFVVILFYVVRDVFTGQQQGFIYTLVNDSVALKEDYQKLTLLFDQN
ncbi:MAG TPA: hypothetical protein VFZ48_03080 [Candidatus Saccharimonadales bacterium]